MLEKVEIGRELKIGSNSFTTLPAGKWDSLENGYEGKCPCCSKNAHIGIVIKHIDY